jgi:Methylamine utilisation protein MauE
VIARALTDAVAFSVALTFGASAVAKLRDPAGFAEGVIRYGILPPRIARLTSLVIIGLELVVAVGFASGFFLELASLLALGLLVAFASGVALNLRRGRELPCMCFGSRSADPISAWSVVRVGLLACGVVLVLLRQPANSSSLYGGRGETPEQMFLALTLALGIVAVIRWLLAAPALISLFHAEGNGT